LGAQREHWDVGFSDTTYVRGVWLWDFIGRNSSDENSFYGLLQLNLIPNLVLESGIRYSDFGQSLVDRKFIEPRFHLSYKATDKVTLHGHYGKFHQNLNRRLFSTPLEVEKGIWYLSDERVNSDNFIWVVQNQQYSFGLITQVNDFKFTLDYFKKQAENIWTSGLDFAVEEDPFAFANLDIRGLELSAQYQNDWMKALWTYELANEELEILNYDFPILKSPYTQPIRISILQNIKWNKWEFGFRWRYQSGRPYSDGVGIDVRVDEFGNEYLRLEYTGLLNKRTSPYHSLDLSINYKLDFKKNNFFKDINFGFHLLNLYNRKNIIKRQFYIDYTKTPFEMSYYDRRGVGISPNLSVLFSF